MIRIKKLNLFHKNQIKDMVSFLDSFDKHFFEIISYTPLTFLQNFLPVKYRFFDESYIITENKEYKGVITVSPVSGNREKLLISQLLFYENSYILAEQLINYIVALYGSKGINSFYLKINKLYDDLIHILTTCCGFRQCSNEQLWQINKISFKKSLNIDYRRWENSDLEEIANIYNDSLITHFRPTLERNKEEFAEDLCYGLKHNTKYRYLIEDKSSKKIIGYFLFSTKDNENFVVDFNYSDGYEIDFDGIMHFVTREILKRKRHFKLFLKVKNYLRTGEKQTEYCNSRGFSNIRTNIIFTKDFYRRIKEPLKMKEIIMLNKVKG